MSRRIAYCCASAATLALASAAFADGPTLTLTLTDGCFEVGDTFTVSVVMDYSDAAIAGGQFFLAFDADTLEILSVEPGNPPFSWEIFEAIDDAAGTLDYAVGIPPGGDGTHGPTALAHVLFHAVGPGDSFVIFREHNPPTMLVDLSGGPVIPELVDLVDIPLTTGPIRIAQSDPPNGSVDVRQDRSISGETRQGTDRFRIVFTCPVVDAVTGGPVTVDSFEIADTAGEAPEVLEVVPTPGTTSTYDVILVDPIWPGAWTTLIAMVNGLDGEPIGPDPYDRVDVGFLPGDVNSDGYSTAGDVLALIDSLNEAVPLPIEQTDVNRSETATPADILRLIDLLNGANAGQPWLGVSLPPQP